MTGAGTFTLASGASGILTGTGIQRRRPQLHQQLRHQLGQGALELRTDNPTGHTTFTNNGTLEVLGGLAMQWSAGTQAPTFRTALGGHIVKQTGATASISSIDFDNQGELRIEAGRIDINAVVANITGSAIAGGTWNIADNATLRIGNIDIATNAAEITLGGVNAVFTDTLGNDALRDLTVNIGTLTLGNDRDFTTVGNFTNEGTLALDKASVFTVTGTFTQANNAHLEIQRADDGAGGELHSRVVSGPSQLAGALDVVTIDGFVPTGQIIVVDGTPPLTGTFDAVNVSPGVPAEFAQYDEVDGTVFVVTDNPTAGCDRVFDAGVDASWNNAANWSGDILPGPADVACLPPGSPTVTYSGGDTTVKSIRAVGAGSGDLVISGGSLTATGDSRFDGTLRINGGTFVSGGATQVANLVIDGGTLDGAGDVTVTSPASTGAFAWSSGSLQGDGELVLAAGTVSEIKGTARHESSRSIQQHRHADVVGRGHPTAVGPRRRRNHRQRRCDRDHRKRHAQCLLLRQRAAVDPQRDRCDDHEVGQHHRNPRSGRQRLHQQRDRHDPRHRNPPHRRRTQLRRNRQLRRRRPIHHRLHRRNLHDHRRRTRTRRQPERSRHRHGLGREHRLDRCQPGGRARGHRHAQRQPAGRQQSTGRNQERRVRPVHVRRHVRRFRRHHPRRRHAMARRIPDRHRHPGARGRHDEHHRHHRTARAGEETPEPRLADVVGRRRPTPRRSRQRCRPTRQRRDTRHQLRQRLDVVLFQPRHPHHRQRGGCDHRQVGLHHRHPGPRRQRLHQQRDRHNPRHRNPSHRWRTQLRRNRQLRRRRPIHHRLHRRNLHDHRNLDRGRHAAHHRCNRPPRRHRPLGRARHPGDQRDARYRQHAGVTEPDLRSVRGLGHVRGRRRHRGQRDLHLERRHRRRRGVAVARRDERHIDRRRHGARSLAAHREPRRDHMERRHDPRSLRFRRRGQRRQLR